jgi:hypothetical protein
MAGGAPCFCPALLDLWESGLPPAVTRSRYRDRVTPNIRMVRVAGYFGRRWPAARQTSVCRRSLGGVLERRMTRPVEIWLHAQLPRISGESELAQAIRYALAHMKKLRLYLEHGVRPA